jgi:6-phosphogluconolactonase
MAPTQTCRWRAFGSRDALDRGARAYILDVAQAAIRERGAFRIVLAGGDTPRPVYASLRGAQTPWSAWHVYFGDERCLPADDPGRNSHMAASAWLDHVPIPPHQVHPIPAERGPESAAAAYAALLAGVGEFDLVLLGLGEDGHTASLFPGAQWDSAPTWPVAVPVRDAPKPPPQRVSLSPERLSRAAHVLFLVSGAGKRRALNEWRAGKDMPASRIAPPDGVDVFFHLGDASLRE